MRILVVDDEFFARKALIKMIHRLTQNRFEIKEAENGKIAQNMLNEQAFDLLLTDIRMPEINGLDLITWSRKSSPDMTAVIISGYNDFEYAQHAIRNKVIDYLLKPVNESQLEQILHQAHASWVRRIKRQKDKDEHLSDEWGLNEILSVIHNSKSASDQLRDNFLQQMSIHGPNYWHLIILQSSPESVNSYKQKLENIFHDQVSTAMLYLVWDPKRDEAVAIIRADQNPQKICQTVLCKLATNAQSVFSMGISTQHQYVEELVNSYQEALSMINQRLFSGWNKVYAFDHQVIRLDKIYLDKDAEAKFRMYLTHGDKHAASKIIQKSIQQILSDTPIRILCFQEVFLRVLYVIHDVLRSIFGDQVENLIINEQMNIYHKLDIYSFTSIQEIIDYLSNLVDVASSAAKSQIGHKGSKQIVQEIKKYIEINYQYDIHFHELASQHFFKNPSYLSRIFKSYSGTTLSQYLVQIRMYHAKELMKQSEMKINQIAKEVGYNDSSHFIQMFKKSEGMTPEEFRSTMKAI